MCAALKVTRQGYSAWRKRPPSAHDLRDAELAAKISEIYGASRGSYGAPRVFAELKRAGERTSRKRVIPSTYFSPSAQTNRRRSR